MKKKICTYFLLMVLTIQVLPIRQLGSVLFSNQFTEELPHSDDMEKGCFKKVDVKSDYLSTTSFSLSSNYIDFSFEHLYFADAIPQNHTGEIHVPPPNC